MIFRLKNRKIELTKIAQVAESADAIGLGPIEIHLMGVQISPWALSAQQKPAKTGFILEIRLIKN